MLIPNGIDVCISSGVHQQVLAKLMRGLLRMARHHDDDLLIRPFFRINTRREYPANSIKVALPRRHQNAADEMKDGIKHVADGAPLGSTFVLATGMVTLSMMSASLKTVDSWTLASHRRVAHV